MTERVMLAVMSVSAASGCMSMESGRNATSMEEVSSAVGAFETRVETHHARMVAAASLEATRTEADAYAIDIEPALAALITACHSMMSGMHGGDAAPDDAQHHSALMMAAVREHARLIREATTLDEVQRLCAAHVEQMRAMSRHMSSMAEMMEMRDMMERGGHEM